MLNKKFSDLFQIRKENSKRQEKQVNCFDQNYFHCRLISRGISTQLIRIQTQVKENGQPLDEIRCKWYIKNTQDFKEIQDVTSEYYQPCLDDVGSIICVQIQPFIQGKKYKGITIMKESQPIRIDDKLQIQLQTFLQEGKIKIDGRIQAIFSQNPKYQSFEFPLQIKMQIINNQIIFLTDGQQFERAPISEQFPSIQFIRKSFNSIIFNYNEKESMKISLNNNYSRDLFALIVRTCAAHTDKINPELKIKKIELSNQENQLIEQKNIVQFSSLEVKTDIQESLQQNIQLKESQGQIMPIEDLNNTHLQKQLVKQGQPQQSQSSSTHNLSPLLKSKNSIIQPQSSTKSKPQEPKQSNTTLILRIDQLNKQLKVNKRKYDQLSLNYNIQKQNKLQIQEQLLKTKQKLVKIQQQRDQSLKICRRIQQLSEDNRFYKNQISIMKKQLKKSKQIIKELQNKMKNNQKSQASQFQNKLLEMKNINQNILEQKNKITRRQQEIEMEFQHFRIQIQNLKNQNKQLQQKIISLNNQRRNIGKQSQQSNISVEKIKKLQKNPTDQAQEKIKQLQMKLKNVQMLLKYKSNQGQNPSNFQLLVNKLTQTITQKQLQLTQIKKINKNLLQQLKYYKSKS